MAIAATVGDPFTGPTDANVNRKGMRAVCRNGYSTERKTFSNSWKEISPKAGGA